MKNSITVEKLPSGEQVQKVADTMKELILVGNGLNLAMIETEAKLASLKSELANVRKHVATLQQENSAVFAVLATPTTKPVR